MSELDDDASTSAPSGRLVRKPSWLRAEASRRIGGRSLWKRNDAPIRTHDELFAKVPYEPRPSADTRGLSLRFLLEWVRWSKIGKTVTTREAVETFLKPITLASRVSFAELVYDLEDARGDEAVDEPTHFVSHAWDDPLVGTLLALKRHFAAEGTLNAAYVWMDVFAVSQHEADASGRGKTFGDADVPRVLRETFAFAKKTIVVLHGALDKATCLGRLWVLYEVSVAKRAGSEITLVLADEVAFASAVEDPSRLPAIRDGLLVDADPGSARCTLPHEAALLRKWIDADHKAATGEDSGGTVALAKVVRDLLTEWLIGFVKRALGRIESKHGVKHEPVLALHEALGIVHRDAGLYDGAERLIRRALREREHKQAAVRRAAGGGSSDLPDGAEVSATCALLASVYAAQPARKRDGEALLVRVLAFERVAADGKPSPRVSSRLNRLALLLKQRGEYTEAEKLYREALAMDREALAGSHPKIASDMNNLAVCLAKQEKYGESRDLLAECLPVMEGSFGKDSPAYAQVVTSLNYIEAKMKSPKGAAAAAAASLPQLGEPYRVEVDTGSRSATPGTYVAVAVPRGEGAAGPVVMVDA